MMKFLVDAMLGKLAKELRMLGYDTLYYRGQDAHELIQLARQQERVILTRNKELTRNTEKDRIIQIEEDKPSLQLKELLDQSVIALNEDSLFSRCLLCNSPLDEMTREEVEGKVPEFIFYQENEFYALSPMPSHLLAGIPPGKNEKEVKGSNQHSRGQGFKRSSEMIKTTDHRLFGSLSFKTLWRNDCLRQRISMNTRPHEPLNPRTLFRIYRCASSAVG